MAGILKPPGMITGEVSATVNACTNVYGFDTPAQAQQALFGGVNGNYNSADGWYWYTPAYYVDMTIAAKCNIWALPINNCSTYWGSFTVQRWNGNAWVDAELTYVGTSSGPGNDIWQKIFENVPAGRYKFVAAGNNNMTGELYLEEVIQVTGITLNKNTSSLRIGSIETLTYTITPANAFDKNVTWTTNNTWIISTVINGTFMTVEPGISTITITTADGGFQATCVVTAETPLDYIKINNTKVYYNNIFYVDANNGNNTTGNGALNTPYKTIQKAITVAQDGDLIYIQEGIYDVTNSDGGSGYRSGLSNNSKNINFVGVKGKTIFQINGNISTDTYCFIYSGQGWSHLYNITFNHNAGSRLTDHQCAIFGYGPIKVKLFNCVINYQSLPAAVTTLHFSLINTINYIECHNCVFNIINRRNFEACYLNYGTSNNVKIINCASNVSFFKTDGNYYNYNLENLNLTTDYRVTNKTWRRLGLGLNPDETVANIGLYGGLFSWDYYLKSKTLFKQEDKIYKIQHMSLIETNLTKPLSIDQYETHGISNFDSITTSLTNYLLSKESENTLGTGKLIRFKFNADNFPQLKRIEVV